MHCRTCGKSIEDNSAYCPYCGAAVAETTKETDQTGIIVFYQLTPSGHRKYRLNIYQDRLTIDGQFWYLKDKEFVSHNGTTIALLHNFIGMGYLNKRSYRKTLAFVFGGVILGVINSLIGKLEELADKANFVLRWIGQTFTLPEWLSYILNITTVICIALGIMCFFSKKKVVEISFTDKRICIPQSSLSNAEYAGLYQAIKNQTKKTVTKKAAMS